MYFTQEDYKKIENWLHRNSVKDTEFQEALPFTGKEIVTVVQDGHNRKVNIQEFINQLYKHGVEDFLNVTNTYRANNITLKEAIRLIPAEARKEGQVITFLNTDGNWEIYQFIGKLNQWNNPTLWNNPFDWEKFVVDSILPDEEDLTKSEPDTKGNTYLSLKNRKYEPDKYSGLGRKILRRRVVEIEDPIYGTQEKNLLLQADFAEDNTVYVVRYDFTLNGQDITLPDNSYIEYEGGSISDGNIIDRAGGLNRVVLKKNVVNGNNILTQEMINKSNTIYEIRYDFTLGEDVTIPANCILRFNGGSLNGGRTIIGNNTTINYSVGYNIFNNCNIKGFNIPYLDVRWFGAISDYNIITGEGTDSAFAFQRAFNQALNCIGTYVYVCGKYKIAAQVDVYGDFAMRGENALSNSIFSSSFTDVAKNEGCSVIGVEHGITAFNIIGSTRSLDSNLKISVIDISGLRIIEGKIGDYTRIATFMNYTCDGAPSRPGVIEKVSITGFKYVFKFVQTNKQSVFGTLLISSISAKFNEYVLFATLTQSSSITLSKIEIVDSELSDNLIEAIHIEGLYSPLIIRNNNFEGGKKILYVSITTEVYPAIMFDSNYSEGASNDKDIIFIEAATNCYFYMNGNTLMNTDYYIYLKNVTFKREQSYDDLDYAQRLKVEGNIRVPDDSYLSYFISFDNVENVYFEQLHNRIYLPTTEKKAAFHKSFDSNGMYSIIKKGIWGHKCLKGGFGIVCDFSPKIIGAENDVFWLLFYANFAQKKEMLLVDADENQHERSAVSYIRQGYILKKFVCTASALNITPMIRGVSVGDEISVSTFVKNPTTAQLKNIAFFAIPMLAARKSNINVTQGEQVGLTIFDTQVGLTTWNGTEWVDATGANV